MEHSIVWLLDWDDTLFPTYSCIREGINLFSSDISQLPEPMQTYFGELADILEEFFKLIIPHTKVYIITNSSLGWVQSTMDGYMGKLLKYLPDIEVISARHLHYKLAPDSPITWKINTFRPIIKEWTGKSNQIIALSDSPCDHRALKTIIDELDLKTTHKIKILKTADSPDRVQVLNQIKSLISVFSNLVEHPNHLELEMTKS